MLQVGRVDLVHLIRFIRILYEDFGTVRSGRDAEHNPDGLSIGFVPHSIARLELLLKG